MSDAEITEHAEKYSAFAMTLAKLYPAMQLESAIEDHDLEAEAYGKSMALFAAHPDLAGIYVTTEASMPVIRAARDAGMLGKLTIITTDVFPELIDEIRGGAVAATIFQRPRAQGRMAFRLLHEFLVEGCVFVGAADAVSAFDHAREPGTFFEGNGDGPWTLREHQFARKARKS